MRWKTAEVHRISAGRAFSLADRAVAIKVEQKRAERTPPAAPVGKLSLEVADVDAYEALLARIAAHGFDVGRLNLTPQPGGAP